MPQLPRPRPLVLVAEDHEDTRLMIRALLTISQFDVLECADGEAAVVETLRTSPDVVLLDGRLPKVDGLAVARAIRDSAGGHTAIVFVSGDASDDIRTEAMHAGCDAWLPKPYELDNLLEVVQTLTHRHRSTQGR